MRLLFAAMILWASACLAQPTSPLTLLKEVPLPNVEGRIDHLSVDIAGKRLFVSALGNGTIEVVSLEQGQRVFEIQGLKEPQGVLYDSNSNRLFVACGGDGTIRSYDGEKFTPLKSVSLGDDADNLRYDALKKQIMVGYGSGGLATFNTDLEKTAEVKLPSHPESFQIEHDGPLVFVNLPKSLSIDAVDRNRDELVHSWKQGATLANFPMAFDEADHRLFVGFRIPARLRVLNTTDGKRIQDLPIVGDTDDIFFDPSSHRIYVIGGEGFADVIQQDSADRYTRLARVATAAGARTGLFIPSMKLLVIAAPHRGGHAARLILFRTE